MRRIAIPITTLILVAALTYGGGRALAQGENGQENMAQRLAERFNLNEEEVDLFFQEMKEEKRERHQAMFEAMLDESVEAGKISHEQKVLIIDKFDEIRAQDGSVQDYRELKTELESWAQENDIDLSVLMPMHGHHHVKFGGLGR